MRETLEKQTSRPVLPGREIARLGVNIKKLKQILRLHSLSFAAVAWPRSLAPGYDTHMQTTPRTCGYRIFPVLI
jgi:hypothetical protein